MKGALIILATESIADVCYAAYVSCVAIIVAAIVIIAKAQKR